MLQDMKRQLESFDDVVYMPSSVAANVARCTRLSILRMDTRSLSHH